MLHGPRYRLPSAPAGVHGPDWTTSGPNSPCGARLTWRGGAPLRSRCIACSDDIPAPVAIRLLVAVADPPLGCLYASASRRDG